MIKRIALALVFALMLWPAMASAKVLDIKDFTTPAGIKVWLVEDHTLPVIGISFSFKGGAAGNTVDKQGVTQLLSNTLDEGAGDMKSEAFQTALRDQAIDLSFDATRDDFSGDVRTLTRHRDEAVKLLKLAVASPRFDAEAVARMRDANLSRIRSSLGDADWIASRLLFDRIYKGHPYAYNTGGTLAGMAKLTAKDLRDDKKRIFMRDKLYIGIAGDISQEDAARIVDDIFGSLPVSTASDTMAKSDMPQASKPVFYAKDMPQTVVSMAWAGIGIHDPDYYAAQVFNYIYGGGSFSSRLMTEVREKRGLTYGIYSSIMNLDYADRLLVSGSMRPENVKKTIDLVKSIALSMKDTDVAVDELQGAKDYLVGSMPLGLSSTMRIASALSGLQRAGRPVTALDDYRAKIEAVTPADIRRVAGRIFAAEPVIVLVGANPADIDAEIVTVIPNTEKADK